MQGVKGKASLTLTSKDGKVPLAFSTILGHLSNPLKNPQPLAQMLQLRDLQLLNLQLLELLLLDLQLLAVPPAPCLTYRSLLDLQLLDFQLLDLQLMNLVPYNSANVGWPSKRENG